MIGQSMKQVITGDVGPMEKAMDKLMAPAGKADDMTWGVLYNAVKMEVKDTHPDLKEGTEEFDKVVSERFDDVVDKTQVVDTVLHKTQFMRNKGGFNMMEGAFMAEPMLTYNMLRRGISDVYNGKPEAQKKVAKVAAVFATQAVINGAAQAIMDAIRSDDDDDYIEKWWKAFQGNALDNMNVANMIPYLKTAVIALKGWESKRPDMEGVTLLAGAVKNVPEVWQAMIDGSLFHDKPSYKKFKNLINGASKVSGVPLYNIWRDAAEPILKMFNGGPLINGKKASDIYKEYYDDIAGNGAYEKANESESSTSTEGTSVIVASYLKALKDGDTNAQKKYKEELAKNGITGNELTKKLRTALGKADPRITEAAQARLDGNQDKYIKIAQEMKAEGFDQDLVVTSINNKMVSLKNQQGSDIPKQKTTTETEKEVVGLYQTADIVVAIDKGKDPTSIINDIAETKKKNGKTDKEIRSSIKSSLSSTYKSKYVSATSSERLKIANKLRSVRVNGSLLYTSDDFSRWEKEVNK